MKGNRRQFLKDVTTAAAGGPVLLAMSRNDALAAGQNPTTSQPAPPGGRERLLLDSGWRFHLGHALDPAQDFGFAQATAPAKRPALSPSAIDFDDSAWKPIDLPHDWAVELDFVNDPELLLHGFKPLGRDYPGTSIGWYRYVFEIPSVDVGRRISVEFDGIYRDYEVAVNGYNLGRHNSGYAPSRYDLTDVLNYGGKNALVVRADATQFEGWWYEGAGIYRHVWLVKTHPVHIAPWGTYVRSEVTGRDALLTISTEVDNDGDSEAECRVVWTILDESGEHVGSSESSLAPVGIGTRHVFQGHVRLASPLRWSIEEPHLYRVATTLSNGGAELDRYECTFGIRTIRFDADRGFFLNDKPVKIQGTCNHQDHAGVGIALPDRIQYYRIEKLKEMGSNAYRTAHNPATPELLEATDRLGMLVMAETRVPSSNKEGQSHLETMIRRDRNHPSIILWSLGNEQKDQGDEKGARIAASLKRLARRLDPTRPVTFGMDEHWGKGVSHVVDVQGFNYKSGGPEMDEFHRQFPRQPALGSEVASTLSTRGRYVVDKVNGHQSAYDVNIPEWGATAEGWWRVFVARPYLAGGFVWTGFDYRGEPTTYQWPCISSAFGILDTCGFPKDNFYYYQSWWGTKPVLHLFPHWNWPGREGEGIDVWCHTNLDRVELFLNGASLGAKTVPRYSHLEWKVKYAPGVLEARGFKDGRHVLTSKRETTGGPAAVALVPDRYEISADGQDVSMIEVRVVDGQGRIVPVADDKITFQLSGPGRLIGVGNGNPSSHEADKGHSRKAFNGLCQAIVQSTKEAGELRVKAEAPGLKPATAVIIAKVG